MKKLLLFTALLSASFLSICPSTTKTTQNIVVTQKNLVSRQGQTDLSIMITALLASIKHPDMMKSDNCLQILIENTNLLQDGLKTVFVRDLDDKSKTDILDVVRIMQEQTTQLLEKFKDSNRLFNQYTNDNCKLLLQNRMNLNNLTEKINGVNLALIAGKNTLSWINNHRIKTIAMIIAAPFAIKMASTAAYYTYQKGFNPFNFIMGTAQWAITPLGV